MYFEPSYDQYVLYFTNLNDKKVPIQSLDHLLVSNKSVEHLKPIGPFQTHKLFDKHSIVAVGTRRFVTGSSSVCLHSDENTETRVSSPGHLVECTRVFSICVSRVTKSDKRQQPSLHSRNSRAALTNAGYELRGTLVLMSRDHPRLRRVFYGRL